MWCKFSSNNKVNKIKNFENTIPDWNFHLKQEIHLNEISSNNRKIHHLPYTNKTECKLAAYSEKNESTSWKKFKTGHYTTGGGMELLQDVLWFVNGFLIIILLALKKYKVYKEYGNM